MARVLKSKGLFFYFVVIRLFGSQLVTHSPKILAYSKKDLSVILKLKALLSCVESFSNKFMSVSAVDTFYFGQ